MLLRCPALRENYYPTPLLAGAHAQTIVASIRGLGTFPLLDLERQLVCPTPATLAGGRLSAPAPRGPGSKGVAASRCTVCSLW
jgi:hypothetical protein